MAQVFSSGLLQEGMKNICRLYLQQGFLPVERGFCRHHHRLCYLGPRPESLHRHQHQGRVLPLEGAEGIYALETADRAYAF